MDKIKLITDSLNGPQRNGVEAISGPLLILAGAGSGKTRVLTYRMAQMIATGAAAPEEILCVTFTNKAAREMEARMFKILADLDVPLYANLWISTFHSFCVRILKQHITMLDYKPFFVIYDSSDQLSQIKKSMDILNIDDKIYPAKNFQWRISSAKMMGYGPIELAKSSRNIIDKKAVEVYQVYEVEMKKANALDFDDLLLKTHELFKMYPDLLSKYQEKFKFIMVDEYQDTNRIQYLIVKQLAEGHRNLCVVGDEDQSIYSWRGADITNILNFESDFKEAKVIKLEENYRSTGNIVNAATSVIKNNRVRKDKTLFTSNQPGSPVAIREVGNEYDEARMVAKTIETMINEGHGTYGDYAIFYRTNAQSRVIEEQLRSRTIPYRIIGGIRFYDRMEVKDILSYMKLALNPADDLAFKRIINVPARGIGKTTVEKLEEFAMKEKEPMLAVVNRALEQRLFNAGTSGKIRRFVEIMDVLQGKSSEVQLLEFYQEVLDLTEYAERLKTEKNTEAEARLQNLEELYNAMEQFVRERGSDATIQAFLEELALVSDIDSLKEEVNSVTLMTLHISKGLEFPFVFIVGLEENLFPSGRSQMDSGEEDGVEEERRLAYVGMTRAREKLWMSYAHSRRVWGQEQFNSPSRFLKEIPNDLVEFRSEVISSTPTFGGGFADRHRNSFSNQSKSGAGETSRFRSNAKGGFGTNSSDGDSFQNFPDYESDHDDGNPGKDKPGTSKWQKGMNVRHPTFGTGSIFETEGSGEDQKVSVVFNDRTVKKFVVKYARLERI